MLIILYAYEFAHEGFIYVAINPKVKNISKFSLISYSITDYRYL
jgi:hypothetical protein